MKVKFKIYFLQKNKYKYIRQEGTSLKKMYITTNNEYKDIFKDRKIDISKTIIGDLGDLCFNLFREQTPYSFTFFH